MEAIIFWPVIFTTAFMFGRPLTVYFTDSSWSPPRLFRRNDCVHATSNAMETIALYSSPARSRAGASLVWRNLATHE